MSLELRLRKPGEKLRLSLNKGATFKVELFWESDHDPDAHALLARNDGNGARVSDFDQVLSTYNSKKTNPQGVLVTNPDGSFSTPCGTLTHSGDALTGGKGVNEVITIQGANAPEGVNEIPIIVTIHKAQETGVTFSQIKNAGIRIKDDAGKVLGEYKLSNEFARFNAVQMGSVTLGPGGWEYQPVGSGFNGDFNTVLGTFS